ncbi:hypothetical protein KKB99_03995 [bacterium]|nr:hypothetical protein [bacterium]MBU1025155.1 hypothetical protein [bacterium]
MDQRNQINRDLSDLLVVKLGGKSLANPDRIRNLARRVIEFHETRPVMVVVSAIGNDTNRLIKLADDVSGGECNPAELTQIVSFGENLSANIFVAALKSLDVDAEAITTTSSKWPLFIKSDEQVALSREKINQTVKIEIMDELSLESVNDGLIPLLKQGTIPVVSGFLALSENRELLTLGRGGSDTSAFLLAKLLNANEVLIITDVQGVMKADPKLVDETRHVNYISIDEIDSVTRSGGQILHPQSLAYKTDSMKARIVHFEESDLEDGGTEIVGFYKAKLKGIKRKLALITIVGEDLSSHLSFWGELGHLLENFSPHLAGLSFTESFIGFYISDDAVENFYKQVSTFILDKPFIKNVAQKRGIARLNLSSRENAENPEMISEICDVLLEKGIKVIEVITNQSDISVFVDWDDRKEAGRLFKRMATDINLHEVLKEES